MGNSKLKGKDLDKINIKSNKAKSIAINLMSKFFKHLTKEEKLALLENLFNNPEEYLDHPYLQLLAEEYVEIVEENDSKCYELKSEPESYKIFGKKIISENAIKQMDTAMSLPITKSGALMSDAHAGYGLPIGGVVACKNAVIPYGVGLDIGCRMHLSIFEGLDARFFKKYNFAIKSALHEMTHFGIGQLQKTYEEHAVLSRKEFREIYILRKLFGKAKGQIGTSGSGNHFVEFGLITLEQDNTLGLIPGEYVGILSHSGSRGLGAGIANHYIEVAKSKCKLPSGAKNLAWLDLDSEEGQEYWISMTLAGDYAQACHEVIHRKMEKALSIKAVRTIQNHHNFAWKEKQADGQELIVHRKGATPAQKGVYGIIPGSMLTPGYIVSGKGTDNSLNSASHGAGRKFSRSFAKQSFTRSELKKQLKDQGVHLIGAGMDEAPGAYKDIEEVMRYQKELVHVEGKFIPKFVKMDK